VSVYDRWHLAHPPKDAGKCSQHRKVPSAGHGTGLRWQVRIIDADGHQLPKESFEFEQDAKNRDAELRNAVRTGTLVDDKAGKVLFKDYAERWRKTQSHDHPTAERTERMLRNHAYEGEEKGRTPTDRPSIGQYSMGTLARRLDLVRQWVAEMHLAPNTAGPFIRTVKKIFKAAVDDQIIGRNPLALDSVSKPKRTKTDVIVWTPQQVETVIAGLPGELRAMAYLGAVTGPRQGELFGLASGDIDFLRRQVRYEVQVSYVGGRLVFKPLKNDRGKTVPVARPVLPVLSEHMRRHPPVAVTLPWCEKGKKMDGKPVTRLLVFTDESGRAFYRESVNRHWRASWKAAGIAGQGRANGMHILRHTAATRWLSKGLNPAKVAAYLGDTVAVVVSTYAHWLPDDDNLGRAIMDGYLTPGAVPPEAPVRQENAPAGL
jgi:integrase